MDAMQYILSAAHVADMPRYRVTLASRALGDGPYIADGDLMVFDDWGAAAKWIAGRPARITIAEDGYNNPRWINC